MADILRHYGPDTAKSQSPRASCGGVEKAKPLPYSPPVGPKNHTSPGPGLKGGTNHGNAGTQHRK